MPSLFWDVNAAWVSGYLPTFRDSLLAPSSRVKQPRRPEDRTTVRFFFVTKVMDRMWNICHDSCSDNPLPVSIRRWEFQTCWVNTFVGTTFCRKSSPLPAFPGAPVKQLAVAGHRTAISDVSCTREKLTER